MQLRSLILSARPAAHSRSHVFQPPPNPLQVGQRRAFLRDCRRPLTDLGPFWYPLYNVAAKVQARLTLGAHAAEAASRPHEE